MKFLLQDDNATMEFGRLLAELMPSQTLVFLNGPLGAGKTTLVRGILRANGHTGSTKSPTYTLVEPYALAHCQIYHFDLYRLGDPEELEYIGIRDYLDEVAICLIEWPERGKGFLPEADLCLNLDYEGEARSITLESSTSSWVEQLLPTLSKTLKRLP